MGVTAWGVDVGLDNHNKLVAPIQHYRAADPQGAQHLLHQLGAEELLRVPACFHSTSTLFRIGKILDSAGSAPDRRTSERCSCLTCGVR